MSLTGPHPGWQERTIQLLGTLKFSRLQQAHVLVAGMGGVGSMAAEMLCRSGIGKLTIVDGDTVQPGNLNRQLPATHRTLHPKPVDWAFNPGYYAENSKDVSAGCQTGQSHLAISHGTWVV